MVKKVVISSVKCPTGALDILSISLLHSNMVNSLLSLLDTFLDGVSTIDVLEVLLTIYNFSLGCLVLVKNYVTAVSEHTAKCLEPNWQTEEWRFLTNCYVFCLLLIEVVTKFLSCTYVRSSSTRRYQIDSYLLKWFRRTLIA